MEQHLTLAQATAVVLYFKLGMAAREPTGPQIQFSEEAGK
jgi:hypothetical protein